MGLIMGYLWSCPQYSVYVRGGGRIDSVRSTLGFIGDIALSVLDIGIWDISLIPCIMQQLTDLVDFLGLVRFL